MPLCAAAVAAVDGRRTQEEAHRSEALLLLYQSSGHQPQQLGSPRLEHGFEHDPNANEGVPVEGRRTYHEKMSMCRSVEWPWLNHQGLLVQLQQRQQHVAEYAATIRRLEQDILLERARLRCLEDEIHLHRRRQKRKADMLSAQQQQQPSSLLLRQSFLPPERILTEEPLDTPPAAAASRSRTFSSSLEQQLERWTERASSQPAALESHFLHSPGSSRNPLSSQAATTIVSHSQIQNHILNQQHDERHENGNNDPWITGHPDVSRHDHHHQHHTQQVPLFSPLNAPDRNIIDQLHAPRESLRVTAPGESNRASTVHVTKFSMARPLDSVCLSQYHVLVRRCIEFFVADVIDVQTTVQGRKKRIELGQVGIRCCYCQHLPIKQRQKGAVYYPNALRNVYQAANNIARCHLVNNCPFIPAEIEEMLRKSKGAPSESVVGKKYWAKSCMEQGIHEANGALWVT